MNDHAKEKISIISFTLETDDYNHIMDDNIVDDDHEKIIETRMKTSTIITNNKRKYNDSLVIVSPPSYLVYLLLIILSQVFDHWKYAQEESPFLICFDLYNFLIHTSTPVLCNKYLCEK